MSKKRLGKGLGALISDNKAGEEGKSGQLQEVFVHQIEPNPFQPRQEFNMEDLKELAQSIKENGIIQPVTLRQTKPNEYQLVTGERRWRASRMIGLKKVPAIIKDYNDIQMMETALIENLQREDLNPIEEAQAYQRILNEFDMTQEEVAQKVGKSRSTIANMVRLLNLPTKVQVFVSRETISMGHARTLLSLDDGEKQLEAVEYVINNSLSVRETEKYISKLIKTEHKEDVGDDLNNSKKKINALEPEWEEAQKDLSSVLKTKVKIKKRGEKRIIAIECSDYSDLENIIKKLKSKL